MRTSPRRLLAGAASVLLTLPAVALAGPVTMGPQAAPYPERPSAAPARGGVVAIDRDALVAYAADADNAALHHVDLSSGFVTSTRLPCAPEQVLLLGEGRVAVSLRGCNRVALLAV